MLRNARLYPRMLHGTFLSTLRLSRVDTGAQQFPSTKESAICNSGREDEITIYTFQALTELRYPHNEYSHRCDYCSRALPIPSNPPPKTPYKFKSVIFPV